MIDQAIADAQRVGRAPLPAERARRVAQAVAALVIVAIALRIGIGMALLGGGGPGFVLASDDGDAYDAAARFVALGEPIALTPRLAGKWDASADLTSRWPQGYWLFLAANYRVFGSGAYASAIVLQGLLGGTGVLAVWSLARRVLPSERWALIAMAAAAVSSTGIYLSAALYAEALFVPLVLLGLAGVAHARASSFAAARVWGWTGAGGVALALAEATRPVALAVLTVALVWSILPFGGWSRRHRIEAASAVLIGFVVGVVPFCVHDLVSSGHVSVLVAGGGAALGDSQRAAQRGLLERVLLLFVSGGWAPLGEPILSWLGPIGLIARAALFILAGAGAVLVCRPDQRGAAVGWLIVGAILALVGTALAVGLPLVRYRAAADPLLIVCLCGALAALTRSQASAK